MSAALSISANSIDKKFGKNQLFEKANLDCKPGSLNLIVGKNGSGKSTFMRILSGNEQYDGKGIWHHGKNLDEERTAALESFAFVSEETEFDLGFSIQEYPKFFSQIYPYWHSDLFHGILERLKIETSKRFAAYSRGQKMQIAFATQAASRPKIFLLDEITSVLDANARAFVMEWLLAWANGGNTVLLSSNMVSEAQSFVSDLHFIDDKRIHSLSDFPKLFATFQKLRGKGTENKIFQHPECITLRMNSDGTSSFFIKKDHLAGIKVPAELLDKRAATLEDFFIYQSRKGALK